MRQHLGISVGLRFFYSPLEWPKLGKLREIACIGRYHCYPQTACAHCNQRVVRQAPLPNLLVVILGRKDSQHFPGLCPVREVGLWRFRKVTRLYSRE